MAKEGQKTMITKFHENLFKGTLAISTLGASITFQVVIQQIPDDMDKSPNHTFHRKMARNFLAIAWLLFTVALGVASLAAIMLALNQDRFRKEVDNVDRDFYEKIAAGTSGLLLFIMLSAFLFCSLAVTAYCEGAGWAGVGLTVVFLALSLCMWVFHILSRRQARRRPRSHFDDVSRTTSQRPLSEDPESTMPNIAQMSYHWDPRRQGLHQPFTSEPPWVRPTAQTHIQPRVL